MSICVLCGAEFEGYGKAKFCSGACRVRAHRQSVTNDVTIGEDVTIDAEKPCNVTKVAEPGVTILDVEKDLGLKMDRDLGIYAWSRDGIFIRPDITIEQVRRIRGLVGAKNGWEPREYRD